MNLFNVKLQQDMMTCEVENCLEGTNIKIRGTQQCTKYILEYLLDAWNVTDPDHADSLKYYMDEWEEELLIYKKAEIKLRKRQ